MRSGEQIGAFGKAVDQALDGLRNRLPEDLLIARTSDQPRQVRENLDLLMNALYEAIVLVVLVAWVGFWEWRSALLIALAIPITLAMTFGATTQSGSTFNKCRLQRLSSRWVYLLMIPSSRATRSNMNLVWDDRPRLPRG